MVPRSSRTRSLCLRYRNRPRLARGSMSWNASVRSKRARRRSSEPGLLFLQAWTAAPARSKHFGGGAGIRRTGDCWILSIVSIMSSAARAHSAHTTGAGRGARSGEGRPSALAPPCSADSRGRCARCALNQFPVDTPAPWHVSKSMPGLFPAWRCWQPAGTGGPTPGAQLVLARLGRRPAGQVLARARRWP